MPAPFPPIEPPPTGVTFPDPRELGDSHVVAVGSDFRPATLLEAYRRGIFPWPHSARVVPWCSVDPRAVFPLDSPQRWSRSLRRTLRITPLRRTVDAAFRDVVVACGDERPDARWIIPPYVTGYRALHELGWAHSIEVWEPAADGGEGVTLVGGIYGVAIGGLFAGESMFHRRTDASKIAFATLVASLRASGFELFDVQVMNPHLQSLGCVEISRDEYLDRVARATAKGPLALRLALP